MNVRAIALYRGRISSLAGRSGVKFRCRKRPGCTVVPCDINSIAGRSVAAPKYDVPEGTPRPIFRAQFETTRPAVSERRAVSVLLSAEPRAARVDPEQIVLSPIYDDGYKMLFEFRRAHILTVDYRGDVEMRFVAIDPVRGIVGTKTLYRFNTRVLPLTTRCAEHVAGAIDLYPPRERREVPRHFNIPTGEANLSFGSEVRAGASPADRLRQGYGGQEAGHYE